MGLGGVAIAILPSIICLKLTFSDGLGGGNKGHLMPFCEDQRFGQLLPFPVFGNFQRTATCLFQQVGGVTLQGEGSGEIFAAKIVDHRHDNLSASFFLDRCDRPAERIVFLSEIARKFTIDLLSGDDDILVLKIDSQINVVFLIGEISTESAL